MISLETACEWMNAVYKRCGFPGIGSICDAGEEWVFLQAPEKKGGEIPLGYTPTFINKTTGESRCMVFDVQDLTLLKESKPIPVPERFQPIY